MRGTDLIARSRGDLDYAYRALRDAPGVGFDTETSGFSPVKCKTHCVQLSDGDFSALVPVNEGVRLGPLADILLNPAQQKFAHHAAFDLGFLRALGYFVEGVEDTMLAEKLIVRGADQSASLAETAYRYFGITLDKSMRDVFSNPFWDGKWTPPVVNYALSDVVILPELFRRQWAGLERLGLRGEYEQRRARLRAKFAVSLAA